MAILVNPPPQADWASALAPIAQAFGQNQQQQRQQQQQKQQSSILNQAFQNARRAKGDNFTAMDLLDTFINAQKQGVQSDFIAPYLQQLPKIAEQERKAKEAQTQQKLWESVLGSRGMGSPTQAPPIQPNQIPASQPSPSQGLMGDMAPKTSERQQREQPTGQSETEVKPQYASSNVNPKFYGPKDLTKYHEATLKESDKGFQRNKKYLEETEERARRQPEIQDVLRQAYNDAATGNVSGMLAIMRQKLGNYIPGIRDWTERDFEGQSKNFALEQFASTPGFRSQREFQTILEANPKVGDPKESILFRIENQMDLSRMIQKQQDVIFDIISSSPIGEVPLNLQTIVDKRMEPEWEKLYQEKYLRHPQMWNEYIREHPKDQIFRNISSLPIPTDKIDWKEYTAMYNKDGVKKAVPNTQVEAKLKEGYKEIK